jgi:hypothetical protein
MVTNPKRRGRPADPSKRTPDGRYISALEWRKSHRRLSITLTEEDRKRISAIMRRMGISTMIDAIRWALRNFS